MALQFSIDNGSICLVIDGYSQRPLGTAFSLLKPNWVVTAKHVVIQEGAVRPDLQISGFNRENLRAQLLYAHPQVDLAVLEVERDICRRPLFPSHHSIASADGLVYAGYAPSRTAAGSHTVLVSLISDYSIELRERDHLTEETVVFAAPESEGGNSGGPILGTTGAVVAAVIQNYTADSRIFARGTSLAPILDALSFAAR